MKTRNKMKKLEQEKFVVPKTVQNVIPIKAVYKDGIFLVGKNMYSKTFLFTDVNYYIACENEKNDLMRQYWAVINSFGNGVTVKLTINNHRFDKEDFEKSILMQPTDLRYSIIFTVPVMKKTSISILNFCKIKAVMSVTIFLPILWTSTATI